MKKAQLNELQSKLLGSVTDHADALEHFATDASIFRILPEGIVYPHNTADVRKAVQFAAERAAKGQSISLVARGLGSDQGGGALGDGLQIVFPAHLNKLLRLDKTTVTVQPGLNYRTLQQTLHTHGRFLPAYPASLDYATIGGAVANDAAGEKSYKYGATHALVRSLKVVLSDGSLIETSRLSARELGRKKGQRTLEGEIYRKLDSLLLDNAAAIAARQPATTRNTAGYALDRVRGKDGSFDLGQILVGSQGTLGLITEITLDTMPYNPRTTLLVGYFSSLTKATEAIAKLGALHPSALEFVDGQLLSFLRQHHAPAVADVLPETLPKLALFVEFDDASQVSQTLRGRRAKRLLHRLATSYRVATDPVEQQSLWKLRHSTSSVLWNHAGARRALPFIEDAIVPPAKLTQLLDKTAKLLQDHDLEAGIWGHAGDADIHLQPFLDLAKKKDIEKLHTLAAAYYDLVISLGGSTSGQQGDGLLRATHLRQLYGDAVTDLLVEVKHIFDPQNILNPMKKTQATTAWATSHLRANYNLQHLYDHVPHH